MLLSILNESFLMAIVLILWIFIWKNDGIYGVGWVLCGLLITVLVVNWAIIFPVTVWRLYKNLRAKCKGKFKFTPDQDVCEENEAT